MPKVKTKKIVTKRFKITKTGKVFHRAQGRRHLRRKKSKSRQRRQDAPVQVRTRKFANIVKQFMNL
ncbi:50S ribosomal protein L35 [Patescibacteria group bacterium]|nr:50S ribosomal protein L35 [Patescibacteria group bacterium]MBU2460225.1 50S ribosomal protein L35 [Patescibacteria group bacterium]MBU2543976.1 50S ribosomal protein L35 [Patescibacteria group bacterium]